MNTEAEALAAEVKRLADDHGNARAAHARKTTDETGYFAALALCPVTRNALHAAVEALAALASKPDAAPLNSDSLWQLAIDECNAFECNNDAREDEDGMHFRNRAGLLRFAALVIDRTDAERAALAAAPVSPPESNAVQIDAAIRMVYGPPSELEPGDYMNLREFAAALAVQPRQPPTGSIHQGEARET